MRPAPEVAPYVPAATTARAPDRQLRSSHGSTLFGHSSGGPRGWKFLSRFDRTRRDECILFMLLLEFHEAQLAAQNVRHEHEENRYFVLVDFVAHAVARFAKELGDQAPPDREIFANIRSHFRQLEKHRFIRLVKKGEVSEEEKLAAGQTEHVLYAFLTGIQCYDPGPLTRSIFGRSPGERNGDPPSDDGDEDADDLEGDGDPARAVEASEEDEQAQEHEDP